MNHNALVLLYGLYELYESGGKMLEKTLLARETYSIIRYKKNKETGRNASVHAECHYENLYVTILI